ncbi:hypothetical protein HOU78_gp36 [Vibrio phage 1.204.O._10N.222.46.F12]|uniref:Uncharacterized protein n=1 Tax=Vibrio phage 1.204.O._10N.222.46.F12 TaxID=1881263 RepID=A0A2I7RNN0_9CAUD|nr:hypothetical protein HOU78_gp36 [Vibrio phage 1.204.O._10N.222.46.F12]AUR95256.1 hypothetical protein NVP1204O_36 [Vibrio phage 1.204.O._10N.222.46.F12]
MVVTQINNSVNSAKFPKLMKWRDTYMIVLFHTQGSGTVVHKGTSSNSIGYINSHWVMGRFSDYKGTLTLSNE